MASKHYFVLFKCIAVRHHILYELMKRSQEEWFIKKKKQQLADPHDKFRCRKNKQGTIDKFYFMQKLRETIEFYQEHFETMVNHVILTDFIK